MAFDAVSDELPLPLEYAALLDSDAVWLDNTWSLIGFVDCVIGRLGGDWFSELAAVTSTEDTLRNTRWTQNKINWLDGYKIWTFLSFRNSLSFSLIDFIWLIIPPAWLHQFDQNHDKKCENHLLAMNQHINATKVPTNRWTFWKYPWLIFSRSAKHLMISTIKQNK